MLIKVLIFGIHWIEWCVGSVSSQCRFKF